jgi:hypothetical protein
MYAYIPETIFMALLFGTYAAFQIGYGAPGRGRHPLHRAAIWAWSRTKKHPRP